MHPHHITSSGTLSTPPSSLFDAPLYHHIKKGIFEELSPIRKADDIFLVIIMTFEQTVIFDERRRDVQTDGQCHL